MLLGACSRVASDMLLVGGLLRLLKVHPPSINDALRFCSNVAEMMTINEIPSTCVPHKRFIRSSFNPHGAQETLRGLWVVTLTPEQGVNQTGFLYIIYKVRAKTWGWVLSDASASGSHNVWDTANIFAKQNVLEKARTCFLQYSCLSSKWQRVDLL